MAVYRNEADELVYECDECGETFRYETSLLEDCECRDLCFECFTEIYGGGE